MQGTGNTLIHSRFSDGELIFYNATTGATVFTITSTGTTAAGTTALDDDQSLTFGDSADVAIKWTTTGTNRLTVVPAVNNSIIEFGNGTLNADLRVQGASSTVKWDASQNTLIFKNADLQFLDSDKLVFGAGAGIAGDVQMFHDGSFMILDPQTDDTLLSLGQSATPQKSFDVRIYGNAAAGADYFQFDAGTSSLQQVGAAEIRLGRMKYATMTAKTSDYTVTAAETGTIFHTTGAGSSVAFTLPAKAAGLFFTFINTVDKGMKIVAEAADTLVTFNDVAADDVRFYTAGNKIGASVDVIGTATKWFVRPNGANTMTVTT